MRSRIGILPTQDSFTADMDNNINRMFGLLFTPDHYKDRGDVLLPDFYNNTQTEVFDEFKALMEKFGGPGVYGRVTGRRMHFNTTFNTFLFAGAPNKESILALQYQKEMPNGKNVLVVFVNQLHFFEPHELKQLKDATLRNINVGDDKELLALLVKGCIKNFLGDLAFDW